MFNQVKIENGTRFEWGMGNKKAQNMVVANLDNGRQTFDAHYADSLGNSFAYGPEDGHDRSLKELVQVPASNGELKLIWNHEEEDKVSK